MRRWLRGDRSPPTASAAPDNSSVAAAKPASAAASPGRLADDEPWLVVGLGNPGPSYAGNRHNVGFHVLNLLADRWAAPSGGRFSSHRARADVVSVPGFGGRRDTRAVLAKPRTYMNESGAPVAALRDFYRVRPDHLIVVHDELDLPYASLRLKCGGGDGGHNGLRSVTRALGTPDYLRVRFGIGRPPGRMDPAAFVLRDFTAAELASLDVLVDQAADAVETIAIEGLSSAQKVYHTVPRANP